MRPLFLYGTLRREPLLRAVAGDLGETAAREAALPGHRVVREEGGVLPVLVEHAEGTAHGTLWAALPEPARARIEAWEAPWGYARRAVTVVADGERIEAEAYFPPATVPPSGEDWSLDAWRATEEERTILAAEEVAAHEPPLSGRSLHRQWGMVAHRAHARVRAAAGAPARLRRRAAPGDFAVRRARPPEGQFFKLDGIEVDHVRFDGGRAKGLPREVLVGADAALVLPYDAARDRVLLVEQFRSGPARRGDPDPWTLEPVAGLVDAGESPEDAARREAVEEAGLTLGDLLPMFRGYASPGNATDHFYAFLGLCDLPDGRATAGGLAAEHEDLRLHVLGAEEAITLIDDGEANAVPLVAMLLWLARWRAAP